MRFMIIVKANEDTEAGVMPTEAQLAEMTAYNEELVKAGVFLDGEGLHPSTKGARIHFSGGHPTVVDGPFAETKELIAGFTLIQVSSRDEAIEWVKRWPTQTWEGDFELELRQVFEAADFDEAFTPELQEREERIREQAGSNRG